MSAHRLTDGVQRGATVNLTVDGEPLRAFAGESIAAALLAEGRRTLRSTPRLLHPRGLFCGMGICCDCAVVVDGCHRVRGCTTEVREGMTISTQG